MRRLITSLFFINLLIQIALAQEFSISGKVTSKEDGSSLPGVSISIKDSKNSTQSGRDGYFNLKTSERNSVLIFSYIGYETLEINTAEAKFVEAVLTPSNTELDEVVVAYGTVQKRNFIGSSSVVKSEVFENRPVTSFEKALQGAAAGVQVTSVSGQPGASSTVRIRGVGSFAASSTPLYVLDGVAIANGNMSYMGQILDVTHTADVLSSLNIHDIDEVRISKDASDAAIYGSRAANGVVYITTKKGRNGRTRFLASSSGGYSRQAVKKHEVLSSSEYYKIFWDAFYQDKLSTGLSADAAAIQANAATTNAFRYNPYNIANPYAANGDLANGAILNSNTDWRDEVQRKGITKDINVSAQGGSERIKFFVSGGYFSQDGIIIGSDFKRYSGRFNISNDVSQHLSFGINNSLSYTDQNTPPGATAGANPVRFGDLVANIYPVYVLDANGQPQTDVSGNKIYNYLNGVSNDYNPLGLAELDEYNTRTARVISHPYAELKFLKDFKARSTVGLDYIANRERQFYNPVHGNGAGVNGRGYRYSREDITLTFINTLSYNKTFGKHYVDVLLGQEAFRTRRDNTYSQATNFAFPGAEELISASTPSVARSFYTEQRFDSYFSRANYNFDNKYYLSGSFRRDGSSIFSKNNRYGNFYSAGFAWRIGRENFLKDVSFLDELKLKASYGVSGNDKLGTDNNRALELRYASQGLYTLGKNYEGQSGMVYTQLENDQLTWEKNAATDIGIEFSVLRNRIAGEISYYNRGSDQLLFARPLSRLTGFEGIASNLASMDNYGYEVLLNAKPLVHKSIDWNISFNFSRNTNKIRQMTQDVVNESSTGKLWTVGKDRYQWNIREYAGVDPSNGKPLWYVDELGTNGKPTGNRTTTDNWRVASLYDLGSSLPKYTGGFNNTLRYKQFDFSAYTYFSGGNKIYDNLYASLMHAGSSPGQQMARDILKAWRNSGDVTDIPRFALSNTDLANSSSSRFLFDGSYIRVKNITFGYTFNNNLLKALLLTSARIYVMAENPFTIAKHKGMDPEVENTGISNNDIPNIKTFSVGINIGL